MSLLLARSVGVEREETRSRVCRAVDRLSQRLSQTAFKKAQGEYQNISSPKLMINICVYI